MTRRYMRNAFSAWERGRLARRLNDWRARRPRSQKQESRGHSLYGIIWRKAFGDTPSNRRM
jgi:hypothetical protein